ncbi:MAG: hypothetical protein QOJ98_3230 [Acidobacteriota bacterium]|jgi:hypothetical protein|nr:hypothetical protein [Acidobacteriota bacterium]
MRYGTAFLLVCTLFVNACATGTAPNGGAPPANVKEWMALQSRAKKKAIGGFIIGAALGIANARLTGAHNEDIWKHALAGGIGGAIAGFALGKHEDQMYAHRDLAMRQTGYNASQGYIARVENVAFDPPQPQPGETATLYVRYLVLGPDPHEPITVRMFRGLKYDGEYVFGAGPTEFVIPQGGGIVESRMPVTLPKKVMQGTYSVEALLEDANGRFPQASGTGALYIATNTGHQRGVLTASR